MRSVTRVAPAIAMLVHSQVEEVVKKIDYFTDEGLKVVVHVDKRNPDMYEVLQERYRRVQGSVLICTSFRCKWGGWNLVKAEMLLYTMVSRNWSESVTHIHFMSGSDFLIRPSHEFTDALEKNEHEDFIDIYDAESEAFVIEGNQMDRFRYYYWFNYKENPRLFKFFFFLQNKLRRFRCRSLPNNLPLKLGGQFKTLRLSTVEEVIKFIKKRKRLLRYFSTVWIPDESFFPTVIAELRQKGLIDGQRNRSLTFNVFDQNGRPIVFYEDNSDLLDIDNYYFARKMSFASAKRIGFEVSLAKRIDEGAHDRKLKVLKHLLSLASRPGEIDIAIFLGDFFSLEEENARFKEFRYMGGIGSPLEPQLIAKMKSFNKFAGVESIFDQISNWQLYNTPSHCEVYLYNLTLLDRGIIPLVNILPSDIFNNRLMDCFLSAFSARFFVRKRNVKDPFVYEFLLRNTVKNVSIELI